MCKTFEFKRLINQKGFFCKISYRIEITTEVALDFKYEIENLRWYSAVYFASQYFFDKFSVSKCKGLKVEFIDIDDQIIDTSNMVVFYTVVQLLSKEAGYIIDGFLINEQGNFIIPK